MKTLGNLEVFIKKSVWRTEQKYKNGTKKFLIGIINRNISIKSIKYIFLFLLNNGNNKKVITLNL